MNKLTYTEAMAHVRKYKEFIRIGAIANHLNMNQGQLRQIINRTNYAKELPEKYRSVFINIVQMLVSVEQVDEAQTEAKRLDQAFRGNDLEPF